MLPAPLVLAALAAGQPPVAALSADKPAPPAPHTRALTVSPAAALRPALRYELLPSVRTGQPGNAADAYYRAFLHRPKPPADATQAAARDKETEAWMAAPLDELPREAVRKRLAEWQPVFKEIDAAAARERCDWDIPARIRRDGIGALLTEAQTCRELMRVLALRTRLELAEGRYDDAARSLQAGFRMGKHVGEAPTLIQLLVGIALESVTLDRAEDWISRPGSPNLYWALTALPRPLVDPRPAFDGETLILDAVVPDLARLRAGPMSKDEAAKLPDAVTAGLRRMGGAPDAPSGPDADLAATVGKVGYAGLVVWWYPSAKKGLIARGRPAAEVEAMPGAQVVLLNSLERFLELRDDQWKWIGMPYHLARPALREADRRARADRAAAQGQVADPFYAVFALTLPASGKVIEATARLERRVAFLRAIEAVRMDAAAHDGRPPAALAGVTLVPVPDDPSTGKPFGYELKGATAAFTAPPPDGEEPSRGNALRYEVTFRAK